ncbi:MAG: heavy metal translocating P-type ATPase [Candidatus Saccharibacteria bacterium]|nr:heavy metal translocating P-type ATPase [Candidatus Saccharibacteria bacterium]
MKEKKHPIKNYWYLWLTLIVGAVAIGIQILGNYCYVVPNVTDINGQALISCPYNNYTSPLLIIIIVWLIAVIAIMKLSEMVHDLRSGNFGIDILAIIAIGACLGVGELWAAYLITLMLCSGEALETLAGERAKKELSALIKRRPQIAHLVREGTVTDIDLAEVKVGDELLVKANEVVPVDGKLLTRLAVIDESSLTGEAMPVTKRKGSHIMSGTLNQTEATHISATTTAETSYYSQIIQLVHQAESEPSHFVNLANRYAVPFTILSLLIAGYAWWASDNPVRFAEVLVVASPCPLILAAPIAFVAGMSRCSHRGIIVKNGNALEQTARADVFAFDKTGTITTDKITVDHIDTVAGYSANDIVSIVTAVESISTHILAHSVIDYAETHNIQPANARSIREATGGGLFATVDKKRIVIGSQEFLTNNKISDLPATKIHDQTSILVAINGKYAGAIYFSDRLRRGAKTIARSLRQLGVRKLIMLTGDRQTTATQIGREVKMNHVYAQLKPTDKLNIIRDYQNQRHRVAMVGDGINDAPVLATANVGVAMGVMGSTVAGETADIIITGDHISRVVELRQIAKHTITVARQSVLLGMIVCLCLEIVAVFGFIPVIVGALLQELIDVLTIINALRAHK